MDEEFRRERSALIRDLAQNAGPWVKDRLVRLAARYDDLQDEPVRRSFRQAINWPTAHASER